MAKAKKKTTIKTVTWLPGKSLSASKMRLVALYLLNQTGNKLFDEEAELESIEFNETCILIRFKDNANAYVLRTREMGVIGVPEPEPAPTPEH
jgi:hypothetical protein